MNRATTAKSSLRLLSLFLAVLLISAGAILSVSASDAVLGESPQLVVAPEVMAAPAPRAVVPLKIVKANVGSGKMNAASTKIDGFQAFSVTFNKAIDYQVLADFAITHEYHTGDQNWISVTFEKSWEGMLVKDATGTGSERWASDGTGDPFIPELIPAQSPIHYVESQGKEDGELKELFELIKATSGTDVVVVRTVFLINDGGTTVRIPMPDDKVITYSNGAATVSIGFVLVPPGVENPNVDITPPVITLLGDAAMTLTEGVAYVEPGFTATDNADGDITANVVESGTVGTTPGSYEITYVVKDAAGNESDVMERIVTVKAAPRVQYSILATAASGGTVTGYGDFEVNAVVTLTAKPSVGYAFEGWYEGGVKVVGAEVNYSFPATANRNLEARFTNISTPSTGGSSSGGSSTRDKRPGGGGGGGTGVVSAITTTSNKATLPQLTSALNGQISAGKIVGGAATVRLTGKTAVDAAVLKEFAANAAKQGITDLRINFDTIVKNVVVARVTVNPALITENLQFVGTTDSVASGKIAALFTKSFRNKLVTLSFPQGVSSGQKVWIAIKLPAGMNGENLAIYRYDVGSNNGTRLLVDYRVDGNGYVHFEAELGSSFIVSEGALS